MKWTDIWQAPFWYDDCGYIFDKNNTMTFTVDDLTESNWKEMDDFCRNIVTALNGDGEVKKYPGLEVKDGCDIYRGEECIGYFRGWGHLTGGLKLSEEEAASVQDELVNYVMSKIS